MPIDDEDDDRPRRRPRRDDDDDDAPPPRSSGSGSAMPAGAKIAGIIWIAYGSLGILSNIVSLIMTVAQGGPLGANLCGTVVGLLIAGAFLFVGFQTVKGTAKSTLGNGIGSLILGALQLACGGLMLAGGGIIAAGGAGAGAGGPGGAGVPAGLGTIAMIMGGLVVLFGITLITAGILALMNKTAYEDWRAGPGLGGKRRRRTLAGPEYR